MFVTNLRLGLFAALLPCSVLFVAPGISDAQLFSPLSEQTSEASNPIHTAQRQESGVIKNALFVRLEAKPGNTDRTFWSMCCVDRLNSLLLRKKTPGG
jgi:hypothetical protein